MEEKVCRTHIIQTHIYTIEAFKFKSLCILQKAAKKTKDDIPYADAEDSN